MSTALRLLLPGLLALIAAGCSPRREVEQKLATVDRAQLREEAAVLYKQIFAGTAPDFTAIKPDEWPATFRALGPRSVGGFKDGFSLSFISRGGIESGLYVVPQFMDVEPSAGRRAQFEKIADGIYWYSFQP
jgi:hypothetical protein